MMENQLLSAGFPRPPGGAVFTVEASFTSSAGSGRRGLARKHLNVDQQSPIHKYYLMKMILVLVVLGSLDATALPVCPGDVG